jgi:hypothetical protein
MHCRIYIFLALITSALNVMAAKGVAVVYDIDIGDPALVYTKDITPYREANDTMESILREIGAPVDLVAFIVPRTAGPRVILVAQNAGFSLDDGLRHKIVNTIRGIFARSRRAIPPSAKCSGPN